MVSLTLQQRAENMGWGPSQATEMLRPKLAMHKVYNANEVSLHNKPRDIYYMREMGTFRNSILLKLYLENILKFTA